MGKSSRRKKETKTETERIEAKYVEEDSMVINWDLAVTEEEKAEIEAKIKDLPGAFCRGVMVGGAIKFFERVLEIRKTEGEGSAGMFLWTEENRKILEGIVESIGNQVMRVDTDPTHYGVTETTKAFSALKLQVSASESLKIEDLQDQLKAFGIEIRSGIILSAMIKELDNALKECKEELKKIKRMKTKKGL